MKITISKQEYELHFGMAFLREANRIASVSYAGMDINAGGMAILMAGAGLKDPDVLVKLIKCGLASETHTPTNIEIDLFVEGLIEKEDFDSFYNQILDEIKKQPVLMQALKAVTTRTA